MTENTPISAEKEPAPNVLEQLHLDEMKDILTESNTAFLLSKSEPLQTTESLIAWMQHEPRFIPLGYKRDGVVISYIIGLGQKNDTSIAIGPMYVSVNYQGQGLGRKQVEDFIEIAETQGIKEIHTKTWLGNNASRSIFESLGFVESGIVPEDRVDGDTTIKYRLEL